MRLFAQRTGTLFCSLPVSYLEVSPYKSPGDWARFLIFLFLQNWIHTGMKKPEGGPRALIKSDLKSP